MTELPGGVRHSGDPSPSHAEPPAFGDSHLLPAATGTRVPGTGWDGDANPGVTPAGAVTQPHGSQPTGGHLQSVQSTLLNVSCLCQKSQPKAKAQGVQGVWQGGADGLAMEAGHGLASLSAACQGQRGDYSAAAVQERCWTQPATGPSQQGFPGCQGCPAFKEPLFPGLTLKTMLQIPESRESSHPP